MHNPQVVTPLNEQPSTCEQTTPATETLLTRQRRIFGCDPGQDVHAWSKEQLDEMLRDRGDNRRPWPREGGLLCEIERIHRRHRFSWNPIIVCSYTTHVLGHDAAGFVTIPESLARQLKVAADSRANIEQHQCAKTATLVVDNMPVRTYTQVKDLSIRYINRPTFRGQWVTLADLLLLDHRIFTTP
jgi:hypothetical protein